MGDAPRAMGVFTTSQVRVTRQSLPHPAPSTVEPEVVLIGRALTLETGLENHTLDHHFRSSQLIN